MKADPAPAVLLPSDVAKGVMILRDGDGFAVYVRGNYFIYASAETLADDIELAMDEVRA